MADILIADDERAIRSGLRALLRREGHSVRAAKNGDEAVAMYRERRPDLMLLDVMMPKRSGFSVCEEIRVDDALTPVIFLTAKDSEADQVLGFGLGADDYVSKTAGEMELLVRVRRALQRFRAYKDAASGPRTAKIGGVEVDFDALTVRGADVDERLTKTEADLLWLLNTARGKLVPYGEIVEVLQTGGSADETVLRPHVSRIKKKLGRAGSLVYNERGVGYKLI